MKIGAQAVGDIYIYLHLTWHINIHLVKPLSHFSVLNLFGKFYLTYLADVNNVLKVFFFFFWINCNKNFIPKKQPRVQ